MLLRTLQEIRQYVRLSNTSTQSSLPPMAPVEQIHLLPLLGQALYDELDANYATLTTTGSTTVNGKLLQLCQQFMAPQAMADNMATYMLLITDAGIKNPDTANSTPATLWQTKQLKAELLQKAAIALELLIRYLYKNAGSLPLWTASDEYTQYNGLLIKTAEDFHKHYFLYEPYKTYHSLRPVMQEVEELYIIPAIGRNLFTWAKGRTTMVVTVNSEEVDAMVHLKKAIAHFTLKIASLRYTVNFSAAGFTILSNGTADAEEAGRTDGGHRLEQLRNDLENTGQQFLQQLQYYLTGAYNGSFSDGFDTGFDTAFATSPLLPSTATLELETKNADRKIFVWGR